MRTINYTNLKKTLPCVFFALLLPCMRLLAQTAAPNISYSPNTYTLTQGTAISTISPTNTGGTVPVSGTKIYTTVTTLANTAAVSSTAPLKMTIDHSGNLYVIDYTNKYIKKITPTGTVSNFFGKGSSDSTAAGLWGPYSITIDPAGQNLYVGDQDAIRKISISSPTTAPAIIGHVSGGGMYDANGTKAYFYQIQAMAFSPDGNTMYVCDYNNNAIRKIDFSGTTPTYAVTTIAGAYIKFSGGASGPNPLCIGYTNNSTGLSALFNSPIDLTTDGSNLFVVDRNNNAIREVSLTAPYAVTTFAGSGPVAGNTNNAGNSGSTDNTGTSALFNFPSGIAIDGAKNLYIADGHNYTIRKITPGAVVSTLVGVNGTSAIQDGVSVTAVAQGLASPAAEFSAPYALVIGSTTNPAAQEAFLYVVDRGSNNAVRAIDANGYTISPQLPAGLVFNSQTGVITGTPSAAVAPAAYTITAYNFYGSSSFTIYITVNAATIASPVIAVTNPCASGTNATVTATETYPAKPSNTFKFTLDGTATGSGSAASGTPYTFSSITPGVHYITATANSGDVNGSNGSITGANSSTYFTVPGTVYTWAGTTSSDPTVASNWSGGVTPPFDGTCSITIPNVTSPAVYPSLTASESVYNLSITGSSASLNLNGYTLNVGCNIVNTQGGLLTYGTNLSSTVNWNGNTTQFYQGFNTTALTCELGNMTINNSGNTILFKGGVKADLYNVLTLTAGSLTFQTSNSLTLKSSATQTATVAAIPSSSSVSGTVNVERYITGGNGYRGYRLLSSPVNASTNTSGGGSFSFAYINTTFGNNNGAFTGGPGGSTNGFTFNNANPTIYLYNEAAATNNNTFITGKDIGITAITSSTVSLSNGATNQSIPVGNGYLMYFIGDNSRSTAASSVLPQNTTITATGTLNQGTIPVTIWSNNSTSLPYTPSTATTTPGGAMLAGLSQVGNPYASTISLDQFWADNNPSGSTSGISSFFYELQEPGQAYITYDASSSHRSSSSNAGPYIVSGQGFVTQAQGTGQTVTFKETEKVNNQITSSTTPTLLLALKTKNLALAPTPANAPAGLHLQLSKDSLTNTQTGIYFSSAWNDKYTSDDAADLGGFSTLGLSSLSSDGVRLGINSMGDYITGKRVKLFVKANTTAQYTLKMADVKNIDAIYNIFLVDNLLKDSVNLRTTAYNFTITTTDTTTFGANRFVLAVELKALPPYKLVTFTGKKAGTGIQLAWTTTNEGYYTGFVLQKQTGTKFFTIDSLQGNSSGNYSYLDANAALGLNTYRLKQIDAAGNITYSALVNVNTSTNGAVLSIYPNPTRDGLGVMVNQAPNAYNLNIYNSMGALVKQVFMSSNTWEGSVAAYNPGTYIIEVVDKKGNFVGKDKFVKLQ